MEVIYLDYLILTWSVLNMFGLDSKSRYCQDEKPGMYFDQPRIKIDQDKNVMLWFQPLLSQKCNRDMTGDKLSGSKS